VNTLMGGYRGRKPPPKQDTEKDSE